MVHSLIGNHPPLVCGRAVRNGVSHALIGAFLLVFLAPFVLVMSYIVTAGLYEIGNVGSIVAGFMRIERNHNQDPRTALPLYKSPGQTPEGAAGSHTFDRATIVRTMPVTVGLLSAGMVILLLGMSSATTVNLLARTGARAARAEGPGSEAARTLAMLSAKAGIDPSKLYIIHCSFPTSFSASTDGRQSVVAVTTGALDLLDAREMEALLAHEIAHLVNRDSRLEAILAALAALTEYPSRMFQRTLSDPSAKGLTRNIALLEMALSPFGLYMFLVSPILNGLIRAMVLRSRDVTADAHAALLTGDPESLADALAKIGGVVTMMGKATVSSLPAHTSLSQRIQRLMTTFAAYDYKGIAYAITVGKQYAKERPGMGQDQPGLSGPAEGQLTGRVYQLMASEAIAVFDRVGPGAAMRTRLQPGAVLVVFDTPGRMRQVNTADGIFGYISRDVALKAVKGVLPQEVYELSANGASEELLRMGGEFTPQKTGAAAFLRYGLTDRQWRVALGFGAAVFASTTVLLFVFAGR
jgi:Zn-dependent protease with chaperone function